MHSLFFGTFVKKDLNLISKVFKKGVKFTRDKTHNNPEEMSPEVQNRGIIGQTKRSYVLQKLKRNSWQRNSELFRKWRVSLLIS